MYKRIKIAFLLLIVLQGFHSVEEYYGKLWDVFAPARFLCGLVSSDPRSGFLIINSGLFVSGIICWLITTGSQKIIFHGLIWLWIVIETINGIGHSLWSLLRMTYTPGLVTALLLLPSAIYLAKQLFTYSMRHPSMLH